MKKFYLVTGGAGFLGSALVKRLIGEGHKVRVLDDLSRGRARRLAGFEKKIQFVNGDIRDPKAVLKAVAGVDSVCHLAFVNGTEFFYTKPELVLDVGVKGMVNVLDACIQKKIGELALASSSEVYQTPPVIPTDEAVPLSIPDPLNPRYSYGAGKMISEIMAINYGRKYFKRVLIFRPHNVYGPDMGQEHVIPQFILRMKKLCAKGNGAIRFPIQGTGRETRAFVYVDDFIEGVLAVLNKGKHLNIYNIGTDQETRVDHLAVLTGKCFNRKTLVVPGKAAQGGTLRRCPDIRKIKKLGYAPKISLEEGLYKTYEWYSGEGAR